MIVDHVALACDLGVTAPVLWESALRVAESACRAGEYVDVHCQVFTQSSFLEAMAVLAALDVSPFALRQLFGTEPGSNEFIVSLQLRDGSPESRADSFATWRGQI
jgi:hypothetical protein